MSASESHSAKASRGIYAFFIIFLLSGFSGLIYESIWSRYLKLFLGNAAYAQALVIIIFMGGLAIGSILAAKHIHKLKNAILWYGICEFIIGLFGLGFHAIFTQTSNLFFNQIASSFESGTTLLVIKFTLASLIILPQSILLGATFPLITTGLIRKYPDNSGNKIAVLYFLNSFGAAMGVLCSAFILIPSIGLPGAAMTSGIINVLLAIVVYRLTKIDSFQAKLQSLPINNTNVKLFLGIALITGLASFIYEIVWIRMLSMVVGSSSDAFEIMLATFILGLAIGALLIKGKIDKLKNPMHTLGVLQLIMGVLAILTIPLYNELFDYMVTIKHTLTNTNSAYVLYNTFTLVLSMLVMLPATICAGTTLPLITHILIKKYKAESSVGVVYGFNTVGAIIGVLITVQILMPAFGVRSSLLIGAFFDICVGVILLYQFGQKRWLNISSAASAFAIILIIAIAVPIDLHKATSGVFRHGSIHNKENTDVVFHEDGKVSTVSVFDIIAKNYKHRVIANNGKPDAAVAFTGEPTADQSTMYLVGILPILFQQDELRIANIGFGSGLTSEAILSHKQVASLDTIEIEEKIIDAGKLFAPHVSKAFTDKRSNIILDDAKTVFAAQKQKYDIIISEPSNPWVSGVASLFTDEWYQHVSKYLTKEGIFVQWIQGYEISTPLFASVYRALRKSFPHVTMVSISGESDYAILASQTPLDVSKITSPFDQEAVKHILEIVKIKTLDDLWSLRFVSDEKVLDYYFMGVGGNSINSDYFPLLDNGAARARFKLERLAPISKLRTSRLIQQVFYNDYFVDREDLDLSSESNDLIEQKKIHADREFILDLKKLMDGEAINPASNTKAIGFQELLSQCAFSNYPNSYLDKTNNILISNVYQRLNTLPRNHQYYLLDLIEKHCHDSLNDKQKQLISTIRLFLQQDYSALLNLLKDYPTDNKKRITPDDFTMLGFLMVAMIKQKEYSAFEKLQTLDKAFNTPNSLDLKVLFSYLQVQVQ